MKRPSQILNLPRGDTMYRTLILVGLICAFTVGDADALLCKSKKGRITVRDKCKKKETVLAGSEFPRHPQGGPRVVDAGGVEVGAIISHYSSSYYGTSSVTVLRQANDESFSFAAKRSGPSKIEDDKAFGTFLSPNCTGTLHLFAGYGSEVSLKDRLGDQLIRPLTISATGAKGYYVTEEGLLKIDPLAQDVSQPYYQSSSVDGAFLTCQFDTPLDSAAACDPKVFCNDYGRIPAKCFCRHCCFKVGRHYYSTFLAPAKSIDLPAFATPLRVER